MEEEKNTRELDRYIALDIHKEYVLAGGMNAEQVWYVLTRRQSYRGFTHERIACKLREKQGGDVEGRLQVENHERRKRKTALQDELLVPFFF